MNLNHPGFEVGHWLTTIGLVISVVFGFVKFLGFVHAEEAKIQRAVTENRVRQEALIIQQGEIKKTLKDHSEKQQQIQQILIEIKTKLESQ